MNKIKLSKAAKIDQVWHELEYDFPQVTITHLGSDKEYLNTWYKYFPSQSFEYNATVLMFWLVSQGENIL